VRKLSLPVIVVAALTPATIGCGAGGGDSTASTVSRHVAPAQTSGAVTVRQTRYGRVLADRRGRVLYLFTRDGKGPSRCYDACANAWPPYYAHGRGRGRLVGTTRRTGGRRQVTYAGQPLYYFEGDRAPGQVTCQNVVEYGGTWLVVRPSGRAVR
jgi:predicted lipoprotein with Yx(FWY)xxD motif